MLGNILFASDGLTIAIWILVAVLSLTILFLFFKSIVIVHQTEAYVLERIGKYKATLDVGWHFIIPIFDKVIKKVSLKEHVVDFKPQPVITKDNVTIQIDTVVFYQITDPHAYTYGVNNPINAIENLTATTLRNIIGELELDATLTSRDVINAKIRLILDEATDPWGIKVRRVELKNIIHLVIFKKQWKNKCALKEKDGKPFFGQKEKNVLLFWLRKVKKNLLY